MHIHIYVHTYIRTCTCLCICIHKIHTHTALATYLPAYILTHLPSYIPTYPHARMHTDIHTYMHTCIHTYLTSHYINTSSIRPSIHTYVHAYVHTYIVNANESGRGTRAWRMPATLHGGHKTVAHRAGFSARGTTKGQSKKPTACFKLQASGCLAFNVRLYMHPVQGSTFSCTIALSRLQECSVRNLASTTAASRVITVKHTKMGTVMLVMITMTVMQVMFRGQGQEEGQEESR